MALKNPKEALASIRSENQPVKKERLPSRTDLSIDVVGAWGKHYRHTFKFNVPNLGKLVEIGNLKVVWSPNGQGADIQGAALIEQVGYLTATIEQDSLPDWWDPWEMFDATPISALYREATQYEARFHGRSTEGSEGGGDQGMASEGEGQDQGSISPSDEAPVVEGVQPPNKRRKVIISSGG